jgi:hypothetical protein
MEFFAELIAGLHEVPVRDCSTRHCNFKASLISGAIIVNIKAPVANKITISG